MNSCFLHSPFCYSHSSLTPSSQCSFRHPFSSRNAHAQRKNRRVTACLERENSKYNNCCARRVIIFMGFAAIPVLNMRVEAIEGITAENTAIRAQDQKQKDKQSVPESSSRSSFFSLLNALGFLGSGLLAALYALTKKEKDSADATIESMNIKLNQKEAAIASLEKKLEAELLNEKEIRKKALAKASEEQQALASQLKLANDTIKSIGHELQEQNKAAEELSFQVNDLEVSLRGARDEKRELKEQLKEKLDSVADLQERIRLLSSHIEHEEDNVRRLNFKFEEKERELDRLSSVHQQSEHRLTELNLDIGKLKDAVLKNEKELEKKNTLVDKLNAELAFSHAERNELSKKVDDIVTEYNNFKSSAEKKLASDTKIWKEREGKIHLLEEQLKFSLDKLKKNEGLISDLIRERDNLKETLDIELKKMKNLEHELKIGEENLEKSRDEASDLAQQLQHSTNSCLELETEISKLQAEFNDAKELLQRKIAKAEKDVEILSVELTAAKELLNKSNDEHRITSQELFDAIQKCDSLEKTLIDAHKKAESAAFDLREEKKIVSLLNEELKILQTQISKDKESRKTLESDLDEASKSLDEMNRNALVLSKELELANNRISSLEDENDAVLNALDEQKRASREARENLDDAHNLVMRLGKERESLEKRGNKLEEELASAKGEILRLRSQIKSSENPDSVKKQETVDGISKDDVRPKKVTRRRKAKAKQEDDSSL